MYNEYTRELKIPEILKTSVKKLSESYILVVISSIVSDSIKQILDRENLVNYFNDILGNDVDKSKVVKIGMTLEKYKVSPNQCVFITDTLGDIREADYYSIPSVAVTWGFHEKKNLEKGNPIAIVEDPSLLYGAIVNVLK